MLTSELESTSSVEGEVMRVRGRVDGDVKQDQHGAHAMQGSLWRVASIILPSCHHQLVLKMPTFPDGTRIWISRTDGTPLEEYKEQVETGEALKHTRSVCG